MFTEKYAAILAEYEKFWERTNKKRPILNISYAKPDAVPYPAPKTPEEKWLDPEYRYKSWKRQVENQGYLAEGLPMCNVHFGPGFLAACIGGSYTLAERTIWFDAEQYIKDWENPPAVSFDEQSELWQKIVQTQKAFAADHDISFCFSDIGGIMDVVAALRGTENLLYDLYDYPDEVREFTLRIKQEWFKAFDKLCALYKAANQPYNDWLLLPSSKPWYPIQCDFCSMISPAQFEEFVLPDIVDQVNYMDRSMYHLDGPGELPHVDMLLDIPGLGGIQWCTAEGRLWDEKWFGLYKKIQDKNKNLVLHGGISERDMAGAERLVKSIDPTGVVLKCHCSSKEKAEEMLEKVTRWCE